MPRHFSWRLNSKWRTLGRRKSGRRRKPKNHQGNTVLMGKRPFKGRSALHVCFSESSHQLENLGRGHKGQTDKWEGLLRKRNKGGCVGGLSGRRDTPRAGITQVRTCFDQATAWIPAVMGSSLPHQSFVNLSGCWKVPPPELPIYLGWTSNHDDADSGFWSRTK